MKSAFIFVAHSENCGTCYKILRQAIENGGIFYVAVCQPLVTPTELTPQLAQWATNTPPSSTAYHELKLRLKSLSKIW